ncbi:MAG: mechanosensitive ion channel domain-containing protein [Candidatus Omnitrophota bacterium]
MEKNKKTSIWTIVRTTFLPVLMLAGLIAGYIYYRSNIRVLLTPEAQNEFGRHIKTIFLICTSFLMQRIVGGFLSWYGAVVAAKTASEFDDKLVPLASRVIKVVIWVVAFIIILPLYGLNISALIATLGVSSLAIALAAKDTISNMIAGFLIMLDAPFLKGDKVKLPTGDMAVVLDVGLRRSTFLSEDKTGVIILPNLDLSNSKMVNYTKAEKISAKKT